MRKLKVILCFFLFFLGWQLTAQTVKLTGYVFEENNRGYLNLVQIQVLNRADEPVLTTASNRDGMFEVELPTNGEFTIIANKDIFETRQDAVSTIGRKAGEQLFLKMEMRRKPGYVFDVTIAEKRKKNNPTDAISGAWIEVYNNTKEEQVLSLKDHPEPTFKCHFEDGNHYTIMIRKKGFFTKRMEAYVNVEGCILCFDGVGEVRPGVSDVLTEGHNMGTLLANVELQPIEINKGFEVKNIYYDKNSARIKTAAKKVLDQLIVLLKDNPTLLVELGSHTDARGKDAYNMRLSEKRAEAAVNYIIKKGEIDSIRIQAKGYGESQIVNHCKNGVKCDESEHVKNRRTELKVTGRSKEDPNDAKTLAEIIQGEQFDKLLAELENQEVVRVAAGEELPEEIATQLEQQEKKTTLDSLNQRTTPPNVDQPNVIETDTLRSKSGIEISVNDSPNENEKKEATSKPSNKKDYQQPDQPLLKNRDRKTSNESDKLLTSTTNQLSTLSNDFSGYMVEFYTSTNQLSASHEIFSRHDEITQELTKEGTHAYLFGPFADWRSANKFLRSIDAEAYPHAKVVRYKNGKRLYRN